MNTVDSPRWKLTVRVIMILLGLLQLGLVGWARFVTVEVMENKSAWTQQKSDIEHVKEDVTYIRTKLDSIFELRRRQ